VTGSPQPSPPPDVPGLLRRLLADDPGRPRLTWYGPGGERVELSAKVLDNWVAKTANLLVDELDAGPGSRIALVLPAHWRTVTWLLATWSTGACAVLPEATAGPEAAAEVGRVDVLVAADPALLLAAGRPGSPAGSPVTVGVALPALAMAFGPDLPPGALDAATGVRSHGDVFVPFVHPVPGDPALTGPAGTLVHGELLPAARQAADEAGWPDGVRLLTDGDLRHTVRDVLGALARSGSVVIHHDIAGLAGDALAALCRQEGITNSVPAGPR